MGDLALDGMVILKPCIKLMTYGTETNKFLLSCIMYTVCFLHVSVAVMAILREVYCKGCCKGCITKLFGLIYNHKILSFDNTWFKIYIKL